MNFYYQYDILTKLTLPGGCCGRDSMVVGFTSTYAISVSPLNPRLKFMKLLKQELIALYL